MTNDRKFQADGTTMLEVVSVFGVLAIAFGIFAFFGPFGFQRSLLDQDSLWAGFSHDMSLAIPAACVALVASLVFEAANARADETRLIFLAEQSVVTIFFGAIPLTILGSEPVFGIMSIILGAGSLLAVKVRQKI